MRKAIKFAITLFVGAFLFYFIVRETGIEVVWEGLVLFFRPEGLAIIITTFLIVFVGAFRWKEIVASQGERVSLITTTGYLIKGFTVDFLTPFSLFGGEAVRIFLMEKEIGLKKSATSAIVDKIMDITTHFFFLVLGIVLFLLYSSNPSSVVLYYAGGVILILFVVLFLFYQRALKRKSILRWVFGIFGIFKKYFSNNGSGQTLLEIEKSITYFFSSSKKNLLKGIALSFIRHFLFVFRVFLILFFLTGEIEPGLALVVYGLTILSMFLPLPAALGGLEAIVALGFGTLGLSLASGVAYAITVRSADLVVCAIGIILFIRLSFVSFLKQFQVFTKRFSVREN